jgi:FkbM family methyltransferase
MRQLAFVLASTDFGPMIVNRLDFFDHGPADDAGNIKAGGLGTILLTSGTCDEDEIDFYKKILGLRRQYFGDGVHVVDCGANIGTFTVALARAIYGWGSVLAIEAQERLFYALAGNIVLGNHHNARAILTAVGNRDATLRVPVLNYETYGSFGSLELVPSEHTEELGQPIDYSDAATVEIPAITIDSLNLQRLDFLKIDVERMELEVLEGARATIERLHPIVAVEHLKIGIDLIADWFVSVGYDRYIIFGLMVIAIHPDDPISDHVMIQSSAEVSK